MAAVEEQNPIRDIERLSDRKVDIIFNEHDALGKFAAQEQSPLFSVLPRELRDLIWAYALAPFEDQAHPFAATEYYYRPGHTARLKTDTALLRTCRRVWLEANAMPMLQAEHTFYRHRGAPDARTPCWMADLTPHNRLNFGHLHLCAQMFAIEHLTANPGQLRQLFLTTKPKPGDFQPRMLHVTLRHTDWWNWESEQALYLRDRWVQAILDSPDLRSTQTFKLELETLDYKMSQLHPILERIRKMESDEYETHIVDGKLVKTKFVLSPQEDVYTWTGPADIDGCTYRPYAGKTELKYIVTTLTWRLKFPDIPAAFIPEMRRAPRVPLDYSYMNHHGLNGFANSSGLKQHTRLPYETNVEARRRSKYRRRKNWNKHNLTEAEHNFLTWKSRYIDLQRVMRRQDQDVLEKRNADFTKQTIGASLLAKWREQGSLLKFEKVQVERTADVASSRTTRRGNALGVLEDLK